MPKPQELWEIGQEQIDASPQLPISVDVEADGIAGFGSVVQIGAVAVTAAGESFFNELLQPISKEFNPGHDAFNVKNGRGRERMRQIGRDPFEVAVDFRDWVVDLGILYGKKPIFVGLNSGFDFAHVDALFAKAGMNVDDNPFGHSSVDIKTMAEIFGGRWDWDNTKQSRMPAGLLPEVGLTHDALQDAKDQARIFLNIVGAEHAAGVRRSLRALMEDSEL